jgi:hypothetical protein
MSALNETSQAASGIITKRHVTSHVITQSNTVLHHIHSLTTSHKTRTYARMHARTQTNIYIYIHTVFESSGYLRYDAVTLGEFCNLKKKIIRYFETSGTIHR